MSAETSRPGTAETNGDAAEGASAAVPAAVARTDGPPVFARHDAGWQRLSRRSLVVRPLTDLARLLPLLAGLVILHERTGAGLIWGIVAAAAAVVTGLVHWATTRYLVTDERVYMRHGLLNQKRLSVARDRIRTVDITAHVLHRLLGVCRVSIGTGRNDFRTGESFHLDGLTRNDAESLRTLLLAGGTEFAGAGAVVSAGAGVGTGLGVDAGAGVAGSTGGGKGTGVAAGSGGGVDADPQVRAAEPAQTDAGMRPRAGARWTAVQSARDGQAGREYASLRLGWLRFAPLTMAGLVVLGVLFGAVIQLTYATNINLARTGPVRVVVADYSSLSVVQRLLAGTAVAIVGYVLIALIGYVAVFWNFRLASQGGETIRVTRGLLSVRATTISLSRLRGVEISEPLLLRAARGARCIAITTGLHVGRGAENEGSVLLPPAPAAIARSVAAAVLEAPEELCSGPLESHGAAARRRRYTRALSGAAVVVAVICAATLAQHGPAWVWIGSFALLPAAALLAADRYRSLGHRLADGWLVTRTGTLARRRCIIGTDAIIGWRIRQTWFQRRQGLVTLTATTAAGQQHYSVRDVPVERGLAIAVAASGGLMPPFLAARDRPRPAEAPTGQDGSAKPKSSGGGLP